MLAVAGIGYVGVVWTGSIEFCVSCHSMQTPYAEYRRSVHYSNRTGVRAGCPDCHVAKTPIAYVGDKIAAARDLWGEIVGTIDTPQKFAARKLEMAKYVWAKFEATDSRECRSCHAYDVMKTDLQKPTAMNQHPKAMSKGQTCIDCHKGLVHSFPDMGPITEQARAELEKVMGKVSDRDDLVRTLEIKQIFAAADGESAAGRVLPGAPMKVLAVEGKMVRVKLSGWRQEGAERVLYADAGKRILLASLSAATIERLDTTGESVTIAETGQNWSPASFEAYVPVADVTADSDRLWAFASTLYSVNCAICHAMPHLDEYDANGWLGQFRSMVEQTNLGREERALVQTWLQMHGRDAAGAH